MIKGIPLFFFFFISCFVLITSCKNNEPATPDSGIIPDSTSFDHFVIDILDAEADIGASDTTSNPTLAPKPIWAIGFGANELDTGEAIGTDGSGNIYVAGNFKDSVVFGSTTLGNKGEDNLFITKLNSNGKFLWTKSLSAMAKDVKVDNNGNIFLLGEFKETVNFGTIPLTSLGNTDIFVTKLDTNGDFLWATRCGTTNDDTAKSIETDGSYNSYVLGEFTGTVSLGSITLTSSGEKNLFITKIDPTGNFLWATPSDVTGADIDVDNLGNIFVTGVFSLEATLGSKHLYSQTDGPEVFVAKMDSLGVFTLANVVARRAWTYGTIEPHRITVDNSQNIYVAGEYDAPTNFGSTHLDIKGMQDAFIVKADPLGNPLWAVSIGTWRRDAVEAIDTDKWGNVYVAGEYGENVTLGTTTLTLNAFGWEIFVAKLNPLGVFTWATGTRGVSVSYAKGISVNDSANIYVTGNYKHSVDFGSHILNYNGGAGDAFVWKFESIAP